VLTKGPAKKVTIHLNEDTSSQQDFTYERVFSFLLEKGIAGATLMRPEAGFGSHGQLHDKHGAGVHHQHLPVRIEFIESIERVEALLPSLCELIRDGLIDAQDTTIIKVARQESIF
jgi:hypothetical protein